MGDLGALEERQNGWWITQLTGRTHDAAIIDGKSYPTHFIQDILDRCGDITDFQIAVDPKGNVLEFRLVTLRRPGTSYYPPCGKNSLLYLSGALR